jgi:hypothetical protein
MTTEQISELIKTYNTLLLISTKGKDTLMMAKCLEALQGIISETAKSLGVELEEVPIVEEETETEKEE